MSGLIQVSITVGSQSEGQRIVDALLRDRLIACGQVFGPIRSSYWWQGKIETSEEWMCLAKSREENFAEIVRSVQEMHSYEVPEIIAVPLVASDEKYAQWVEAEVNKPL